ncbi:MAG: hypothetical protein CXT78_02290 [Thaumarchaeota archaeon]|jgi:hypothetical protein|nr:MAG: hypothetical protein CXT78_02290 [Nitrososphaerota archaeon]
MQKNLLRKMWWDGRMGHLTYLMFSLQLINFLLITYNFLIEGEQIFQTFLSDLWLFGTIFMIFYIPISILIGKWHTETQISIEMTMKMYEDPITAKMVRGLFDVQNNVSSKKEIEEFRNFLIEIEKRDIKEF